MEGTDNLKGELERYANSLNLDQATRELTRQFLDSFLKLKELKNYEDKKDILIGCAVLVASRSQVLETVSGDKVRGIGLSTSQILKTVFGENFCQANVKDYLEVLKIFYSTLNLEDEVQQELKSISKKFAFIHLFFNQYSKIMKRVYLIGGKGEDSSNDYHKNLRTLSWFLFIIQRNNKFSEE